MPPAPCVLQSCVVELADRMMIVFDACIAPSGMRAMSQMYGVWLVVPPMTLSVMRDVSGWPKVE